jgi:hypothetical protein
MSFDLWSESFQYAKRRAVPVGGIAMRPSETWIEPDC